MPLPQDKMGHFWYCLKLGGKLQFEPTPFLCSNIISVHPKQCVCNVSAFCRSTITHQTTCITELQKNCCKNQYCGNIINCGVRPWRERCSSAKPYWDTRFTSAESHLSFLFFFSSLSLSACDTYGWFSLFHFFFHSKCMLRPIAVLLRTRSDPCKAAADGWLNHDESLGSLIYMPLNSTFGSIRTKSNIYVVYWNC